MISDTQLERLGFSSESMEDDADVFRKTGKTGISALAWFDEMEDSRVMMSLALCSPNDDVLWSGRTDDETVAEQRLEALTQAVEQYSFKAGSTERKLDDALVRKKHPTHYIQVTTRSSEDDRPRRFISRSNILREMNPDSRGRLGSSEDVLIAAKFINTDLQCAYAANAPSPR